MKSLQKRVSMRTSLFLPLFSILTLGILSFTSCGKEKAEEPTQQIQAPQEKSEKLQKELASKEDIINQLKEENAGLISRIPESYEAQKGDSHWKIAYNYLTQKKHVPAEEAKSILAESHLFHPMLVGFKVWNYFYDNVFGSFVTQGRTSVSPGALIRLEKRRALEEKHKLENEIIEMREKGKELAETIKELEKLKKEIGALKAKTASLTQDTENFESKNRDLDSKLNSVYYFAGSKDKLKAKGKIKGTFLGLFGNKIGEITFADFQNRIDLRETNVVELKAGDLNVSNIDKVGLLPKHIDEKRDFRVEIAGDRQSARVVLLNNDKFLLAQIIIFVN